MIEIAYLGVFPDLYIVQKINIIGLEDKFMKNAEAKKIIILILL